MKIVGLVMAGGRGERMRASQGTAAKPLVPIRGISLLERNLWGLARGGLREFAVSVSAAAPEVVEHSRSTGAKLARALGGSIELLVEDRPLGNVGCAGRLGGEADAVVLVFADNLTDLPIDELIDHHRKTGASLTVAAHRATFTMPFGALTVVNGRVTGYVEKPRQEFLVSSAVCVLGPRALELLPGEERVGLSDLAALLLASGDVVAAFPHAALWVDVNDVPATERAERLVLEHPERFEHWAPRIDRNVMALAIQGPRGLLLERPQGGEPVASSPRLPQHTFASRVDASATVSALSARTGLATAPAAGATTLDDLDDAGSFVRHHVHPYWVGRAWEPAAPAERWTWWTPGDLTTDACASRLAARAWDLAHRGPGGPTPHPSIDAP